MLQRLHCAARALFDSSSDTTTTLDTSMEESSSSELWIDPAPVPACYCTSTASITTPNSFNRSLWTASAEHPSLYSPPQSTTESPQTPPVLHYDHPMLGHHSQLSTTTNILTSLSLSPIYAPV